MSVKRDIKGNLDEDSLPVILHSLATRKLSGTLYLEKDKNQIDLCIKEGKVTYSKTNIKYLQPPEFLFEWGFISLRTYEEIKEKNLYSFEEIGREVSIPEKTIKQAMRKQVREIIYVAMGWHSGKYRFSYTTCSEKELEMNLYELLVRGLIRETDWSRMRKILIPYGRIPVFDTSIDPSEIEGIKLSREESYVLRMIDGEKTLEEIIEESKLPDFETARILYAFITAGILTFL